MSLRTEVKVGITVFLAILALIAIYWFLGYQFVGARTYRIYATFQNVGRLDKGADVRMAGVKIGQVAKIRLTPTSKAEVELAIDNDSEIPKGSVARITTGGLVGENYVEIIPTSSKKSIQPGERIATAKTVQIEELVEQTGTLLKQLQVSAEGAKQILGNKETLAAIQNTLKSLNEAADAASRLVQTAQDVLGQTSPELDRVFANLNTATANAAEVSREIQDMISQDARPNVAAIMGEANEVAANLNATILEARQLISSFNESAGELGQAVTRVSATAGQAEQMITNLNEASAGVKELTTDTELQENVKATMRNSAEATEQAKQLLTSLNQRFGGDRASPAQKAAIPERGLSIDGLWETDKGDYRFDANYTFAGRENAFYRLGAYDIGENTRANLQGGLTLGHGGALRYGLYASRVGVGFDYRLGSTLFSADLFRPNDPELEVRGVLGLGGGFGLYGGLSNVFEREERDLLLGLRYRK